MEQPEGFFALGQEKKVCFKNVIYFSCTLKRKKKKKEEERRRLQRKTKNKGWKTKGAESREILKTKGYCQIHNEI